MAGLRIQNIPISVTEKQLKVYFSNPKHGGGSIHRLYYPMPNNSAVVIYDDTNDAQQVLLKKHKVGEEKLLIRALPRNVYKAALVEVDKKISEFISLKPDIVDELQYMGELDVEFSYESEAYRLTGGWYQLEWALQYLDNMLDVYEYDKQTKPVNNPQEVDDDEEEGLVKPEIKKPNIPLVTGAGAERNGGGNFTDHVSASPVPLSKSRKNKNVAPLMPGEAFMSKPQPQAGNKNSFSGAAGMNPLGNQLDQSDSDVDFFTKHQNLFTSRSPHPKKEKGVTFDPTTDFSSERRPAPSFIPHVTKGISVAHTDFGNAPMSLEFTIGPNLHICIAKDSITKQYTDCIVNATSRDLGNHYGISRAILKAVGSKLQADCNNYLQEYGNLGTTQVMHTFAGGALDPRIKFIIHTAGPGWHEDRCSEVTHALVCTYINCLQYADIKLQVKSIAIPLISAGTYGFPLDVCVQAFYDAILLLVSSSNQNRHTKDVKLICFDEDTAMAVIVIIQSLLDCDPAQSVCAAIDRYRSNISQHGFGAENFMLASEDMASDLTVAIKPQEEKPSNEVPRGRKNKNRDPYMPHEFLSDRKDYGATQEVQRQPVSNNRGEADADEGEGLKKEDDDSDVSDNDDDNDGDKDENDDVDEESADVDTGAANDRKLKNVAYGISESNVRKPNTFFEPVANPLEASGARDDNSDEEEEKEDPKRSEVEVYEGAKGDVEETTTEEETVTKLASLLDDLDTDDKVEGDVGQATIDMTTGASGYSSDTDGEDDDSCASVGGSMIRIEKADVEHFED